MVERRLKLPFLIALFAAPALLGAVTSLFGLMGDYGSRFMLAGALGLIASLPAWFTAYPWLAWRDQPAPGMKPRVKAALSANFAALVIFPAIIMLLSATGGYDALFAGGETQIGAEFPRCAIPPAMLPSPRRSSRSCWGWCSCRCWPRSSHGSSES